MAQGFSSASAAEGATDAPMLNRHTISYAELIKYWSGVRSPDSEASTVAARRLKNVMADGGVLRFDAAARSLMATAYTHLAKNRLAEAEHNFCTWLLCWPLVCPNSKPSRPLCPVTNLLGPFTNGYSLRLKLLLRASVMLRS